MTEERMCDHVSVSQVHSYGSSNFRAVHQTVICHSELPAATDFTYKRLPNHFRNFVFSPFHLQDCHDYVRLYLV